MSKYGWVLLLFTQFSYADKAEDFDYYVLALSWQSAWCESRPNSRVCATQTAKDFGATNFTLHGLWPSNKDNRSNSYGYCNLPKATIEAYESKRWCELPKLELSSTVRGDLKTYMPGQASCLQRHEWYKHGTCSGLSADQYYTLSHQLVKLFAQTKFSQLIADNAGKIVKRVTLLRAFQKEFGDSRYLSLQCRKVEGESLLTEIRIYLKKDLQNVVSDLKSLLPETKKLRGRGTCPQTMKIDEVGME